MSTERRPLPVGSALICIDMPAPAEGWPGPIFLLSCARAQKWLDQGLPSAAIRMRAEGCRVLATHEPGQALARRLRTLLRPSSNTDMATVARDLGLLVLEKAYQSQTIAADADLATLTRHLSQAAKPDDDQRSMQWMAALEVL